MNIYSILNKTLTLSKPAELASITSLAIGCFDGLHLAHQRIISELDEGGALLCIDKDYQNSLLPREFMSLFAQGRRVFLLRLCEVKELAAADFAARLRAKFPAVRYFVQGYDFRFGAGAAGVAADLGAPVRVLCEQRAAGLSVHSRTIRELLAAGDVERAAQLLARPVCAAGRCVAGQGLGARELVATVNVNAAGWALPRDGVYAGRICLQDRAGAACVSALASASAGEQMGGARSYEAAIFVGTRSTDGERTLEAHILSDYAAARHSEKFAWLSFLQFIRPARAFADLAALRAQIQEDLKTIRKMHER